MNRVVSASQLRGKLGTILDQVAAAGKFVVIERHGKGIAALVSLAELEQLPEYQELEDRIDGEDADSALQEILTSGTIPWEEVRGNLGIVVSKKP